MVKTSSMKTDMHPAPKMTKEERRALFDKSFADSPYTTEKTVKNTETKICQGCGKEYWSTNRYYCSRICGSMKNAAEFTKQKLNGKKNKLNRFIARNDLILKLRVDKSMTLEQIGHELGITRERVRQIVKTYFSPENFAAFHAVDMRKVKPAERVCSFCSKSFTTKNHARIFCSNRCFGLSHRKFNVPDEVRAQGKAAVVRWVYHNVPGKKELRNKRTLIWYRKARQDPEWRKRYIARQNVYTIRCMERKLYGKARTPLP